MIEQARHNNTPREVMDMIEHFKRDEFGGPQDVMKAYGEVE